MENMEQAVSDLLSPQFRMEIKDSLEYLYDKEKQKEWIKSTSGSTHPYWNNLLYYALDNVYNDFDLHLYKESNIGELFYNEEEASKIYKFYSWLHDDLIEMIGEDRPNEAYLNHPEWHKVYSRAKEVYGLMDANDKKYNFNETYQKWFDEHTKPEAFK